jgi:hypothetical protein
VSGERRRGSKTRVDPVLRRQLESAAAGADQTVEAVLRLRLPALRSARPKHALPVREVAERLFERVARELGVGASAYDWNVFPNLGYSVLKAKVPFVECVLKQPEVASASANRTDEPGEPAQGRVRRRRSSST